jgi:hypothetical protein
MNNKKTHRLCQMKSDAEDIKALFTAADRQLRIDEERRKQTLALLQQEARSRARCRTNFCCPAACFAIRTDIFPAFICSAVLPCCLCSLQWACISRRHRMPASWFLPP